MKLGRSKKSFARRYWKKYVFNVYWEMIYMIHGWLRYRIFQLNKIYACMVATLRWLLMTQFFHKYLWMIICVPEIFIVGDFFTELTQLKFPSLPNLTFLKNSCHHFFPAACCCCWLFPSWLVSVSSNSMKSAIRIPHTTPWQNASEGVIFVEDREDWLVYAKLWTPHTRDTCKICVTSWSGRVALSLISSRVSCFEGLV